MLYSNTEFFFPDLQNQMLQSDPLGLYSPPANPPSATSHELPDSRFQLRPSLTRTQNKPSLGGLYPPGLMPYPSMMYPSMMGLPSQYIPSASSFGIPPGPAMSESTVSKKFTSPSQYIVVSTVKIVYFLGQVFHKKGLKIGKNQTGRIRNWL